jgi:hypothetical protein
MNRTDRALGGRGVGGGRGKEQDGACERGARKLQLPRDIEYRHGRAFPDAPPPERRPTANQRAQPPREPA